MKSQGSIPLQLVAVQDMEFALGFMQLILSMEKLGFSMKGISHLNEV
jgi:hypothetical protein